MRRALLQVETLGPDAVIMSNKKVNGIEIVAAIDPDAQQPEPVPAPTLRLRSRASQLLAELLQRQAASADGTSHGQNPARAEGTSAPNQQASDEGARAQQAATPRQAARRAPSKPCRGAAAGDDISSTSVAAALLKSPN